MAQAKLTLMTLYQYDDTLFQGDFTIPDSMSELIGIDVLAQTILMRCADFELLYPDFDFMKNTAIPNFFNKHYRTFDKWCSALAVDYNPLDNYDRYEDIRDEHRGSSTNNSTIYGTNTENETGSDAQMTSGTSERQESAYDVATYSPKEKTTTSDSVSDTNSRTMNASDSHTTNGSGSDSSTNIHTAHIRGNIGVTTSSKMLEEYIQVQRFSICDQIADLFAEELCLMIY